jgi:heme exporter protein D
MQAFTNYVYEAIDRVVARVEEGTSILMGAVEEEARQQRQDTSGEASNGESGDFSDFTMEDGDGSSFQIDHDMEMESPLNGMAKGVLDGILSKQVGPQTFTEHIHAFCSAVTWKEPFVMSVVGIQALLLVLTVLSIRTQSLYGRMLLFFSLVALSRGAEWSNTFLNSHFMEYGITQNYFDENGFFMTVMICVPAMFLCMALLLSFVWEAKDLLIQVKRMELKKMHKQRTKAASKPAGQKSKTKAKKQE